MQEEAFKVSREPDNMVFRSLIWKQLTPPPNLNALGKVTETT